MGSASLPYDPFNPGHVFGCIGILEVCEALGLGPTSGGFVTENGLDRFVANCDGNSDPLGEALSFLAQADVRSVSPDLETLSTEKWGVVTRRTGSGGGSGGAPSDGVGTSEEADRDDHAFPFAIPASPATLPAHLIRNQQVIDIDHWGDSSRRDNVKFWAGAGGYPGVALLRDALELMRRALDDSGVRADPFGFAAPMSSSFRLDWRRDYIPLEIGFSLNEHAKMAPLGYPIVEVLAAIGLSHARPQRPNRSNKLKYTYCVPSASAALPLPLLRAAVGGSALPFPVRRFRIQLGWPGQEGQARCITSVTEE